MGKALGYSDEELANGPFARFYDPNIDEMQPQVLEALAVGEQAHELFPTIDEAPSLLNEGYWPVETGFTRTPAGGMRVFCLTKMPRVQPQMWDWWFGWHGCEARRYKLWHPKAHIDARWADGRNDESYIGRSSLITEYIGSERKKASINFLRPADLGLDEEKLKAQGEFAVCAQIGMPGSPLKGGWLLHHLRPVEGGCEMRSRMWMGGENAALGKKPGMLSRAFVFALGPIARSLLPNPHELLVHNAQEMAHLAGFLPELYAEFGPNKGATD